MEGKEFVCHFCLLVGFSVQKRVGQVNRKNGCWFVVKVFGEEPAET